MSGASSMTPGSGKVKRSSVRAAVSCSTGIVGDRELIFHSIILETVFRFSEWTAGVATWEHALWNSIN